MKLMQHIFWVGIFSLSLAHLSNAVPQELIEGLGNKNYKLREKSEQELAKWAQQLGEQGVNELENIKAKSRSPEVRSRLDNVIAGTVVYKAIPGTKGFMGIRMLSVLGGAMVDAVTPGTPAEKSGLQAGDIIVMLDGIDLDKKRRNLDEATNFLRFYVKEKKAGEKLSVKLKRNGKIIEKDLKLADYNEHMARLQAHLDPFAPDPFQNLQQIPMPDARIEIPEEFLEHKDKLLEVEKMMRELKKNPNLRNKQELEKMLNSLELEFRIAPQKRKAER